MEKTMAITENVHFRTAPEIKQTIADAAAVLGLSMTDFIIAAATERAQTVLARRTLVLTNDERDRFLNALANPGTPSPALVAAAHRTMHAVREGVLNP